MTAPIGIRMAEEIEAEEAEARELLDDDEGDAWYDDSACPTCGPNGCAGHTRKASEVRDGA